MKYLISLDGNKNQIAFVRGNDGDICISIDIPSKNIMWETVRIGVGNSGGQEVPVYVKNALIKVCEAMQKWENEKIINNKNMDYKLEKYEKDALLDMPDATLGVLVDIIKNMVCEMPLYEIDIYSVSEKILELYPEENK